MLLTDTKVFCVGNDNNANQKIQSQLARLGVDVHESSDRTSHIASTAGPVIWLLLYRNQKQLLEQIGQQYHANHESCLCLLEEMPGKKHPEIRFSTLSANISSSELYQTLLIEEQKILQRNLFHSRAAKAELFTQLNFYGRSNAFVDAINILEQFADTDESVLIQGETGTGKELAARSIHYLSLRCNNPFIPINCGAFTDDLILSELFGFEKGAFTGATKAKKGLLEMANSGTVLLDEVDSLSPKAQVALLRYLQNSEIRPVGSNSVKTVDVRIVAATNQNIKKLVSQGKFREDLMYRLDVLGVNLPPLRDRGEDIQLLAQYFLAQLSTEYDNHNKVFSAGLIDEMSSYDWPGNIRELENYIKRAYLLSKSALINNIHINNTPSKKDVSVSIPAVFKKCFNDEKQQLINQFERDYLHYVLQESRGNISKAAVMAQKERRSFCRLMKKHGLERNHYLS